MPGSFTSVFFVGFDLDDRQQAVRASEPSLADSEEAAIAEAQRLSSQHAGVLVWKRAGNPVVGEEGEPEIIFETGKTGDFN